MLLANQLSKLVSGLHGVLVSRLVSE
jgi:hypothetical protein